jgi:hypothetical protein
MLERPIAALRALRGRPVREWFTRETLGAAAAIVFLALAIAFVSGALTGCAGGKVYANLAHRSDIPRTRDLATSDTLGACGEVNLCATCGRYTPVAALCVNYELTGRPTYGDDPSAHAEFRFPVWTW